MSSDTAIQETLDSIWRDALGAEITAESDFFALGGDSLAAARILGEIEEALGVQVPFVDLFETSTFGEFCAVVAGLRHDAAA